MWSDPSPGVSLVSVIVPTRDRPELLRAALSSVRRVEGPDVRLDVIVVDNGSPASGAAEVAASFGARCLRAEEQGAGAARSVGLAAVRGDFVAFLDDDDEWLAGHLRPHLDVMRQRPEVGAVLGQVVSCDLDLRPLTMPWPNPFPSGRTAFARLFSFFPQIGATVVRASAAVTTGEFDNRLLTDEDWDWQLRLALRHEVAFVDVPCVAYRERRCGTRDVDDLEWSRLGGFDRTFWRVLRSAGSQRPPLTLVARRYLAAHGKFARHFLLSASLHAAAGDRRRARTELVRAFVASPPHGLMLCVTDAALRRALALALTPSGRSR